ncbi:MULTISPECIES: hypothetical protein [unclassified Neochlamydia]|uniref:hypothetical protein n=1 Tax=unclassified Neochlamydia TaxID=2643326 RepID=UPI001407EE85|nr:MULTISPECIES: hypothetical protein [unclassified Neochlamydia]MBS4171342.1 Uncharacterized protein [Neochlamydia sp. AcF95]
MQKGHILQFDCQQCKQQVSFSIFELDQLSHCIQCSSCYKKYVFHDETLIRQLKKFALLCRQIIDSEEILGNTVVGIDLLDKHVKIPYKLLLTRFTSSLDLLIGDQPVSIRFRIEPLKDTPLEKETYHV